MPDGTESSGSDDLPRAETSRIEAAVEGHGRHQPAGASGLRQLSGLGTPQDERFVDKDVLSGREGRARMLGVQRMRAADDDRLAGAFPPELLQATREDRPRLVGEVPDIVVG
jgi:hypothetical protein